MVLLEEEIVFLAGKEHEIKWMSSASKSGRKENDEGANVSSAQWLTIRLQHRKSEDLHRTYKHLDYWCYYGGLQGPFLALHVCTRDSWSISYEGYLTLEKEWCFHSWRLCDPEPPSRCLFPAVLSHPSSSLPGWAAQAMFLTNLNHFKMMKWTPGALPKGPHRSVNHHHPLRLPHIQWSQLLVNPSLVPSFINSPTFTSHWWCTFNTLILGWICWRRVH